MNGHQKIDNMRYGFNGIAGFTKFHSFQGNNYGIWENIIRAEQHMNGQEVKNVISGDYLQGRQQEELNFGNLQNNEGFSLEMQYYLSEDKNSAAGYVYNRTVNYRTAGEGSNCRSVAFDTPDQSGQDKEYKNFDQVTNIDWEDDGNLKHLKIVELPSVEDYDLDFYAGPNMQYLFTSHVSSGTNDKIIVEFPELTKERPIVWFVCKKVGERSETNIAEILQASQDLSSIIYPNPTTGKLYVSNKIGSFEIYNSIGMKIFIPKTEINRDEIQLDLTGFSRGFYYIYFRELSKIFKVCLI